MFCKKCGEETVKVYVVMGEKFSLFGDTMDMASFNEVEHYRYCEKCKQMFRYVQTLQIEEEG